MSTPVRSRDYGGRSAQARREERRERLLEAGLDLFGTTGYAATSIERLCSRASVSTRNFYEEFTSREALLIALHERITERAFAAVVDAMANTVDESMETRVGTAIRAYVSTSAADPRWTRIAYVEVVGVSPAVEQHRLGWRAKLCDLIEELARMAIARKTATDRNYRFTAIAFIGAANELVYHWSLDGYQVPIDDICAELTRLAIAVLTAP